MRRLAKLLLGCLSLAAAGWAETAERAPTPQWRPEVHFSPERNWTNDPNGLVYLDGEYHLFYQYNPFGDQWGHMSWGHAVSPDLLHWRQLPVAIPEANGEMVYTGSVVIDQDNSSGLCGAGHDTKSCMVAVYTGDRTLPDGTHRETQNLAVSGDRGRTFTRYSGNPVLDHHLSDFRDPSVSWNAGIGAWLMAVALPNEHQVLFYRSADLKRWTELGRFGPEGATDGQWECPDLLEIPSTSPGGRSTWALKVGLNPGSLQGGSGEQYFLGQWNGRTFVRSSGIGTHGWTDYGKDSYCTISYNHLPAGKPPVLLGWMSNWDYAKLLPTAPWRGQMTLPREVHVLHDKDGLAISETPVIASLREGAGTAVNGSLRAGMTSAALGSTSSPAELQLRFHPGTARSFGIKLWSDAAHWTAVGFDRQRMRFYVDRTHAGLEVGKGFPVRTEAPLAPDRGFDVDVVLDRMSVEAFAQSGTLAMTNVILPPDAQLRVELVGDGPVAVNGRMWQLRPSMQFGR